MGAFFERLVAGINPEHEAILAHPVVRGIGDGSLSVDRFRFYLGQDYLFLRQYMRVIALAVVAADDLGDVDLLSTLLHDTASVEMAALSDLYASFDGDPRALASTEPHATCRAYTDHLLATAYQGNLLVTLAALLPCQWGYREIARSLVASGATGASRYRGWIDEYLAPGYSELVERTIESLERAASSEGTRARDQAERVFAVSAGHEFAFWEMVIR
jgi:thiaminase/transcriptional activator TenA